jgi:long-chain acyl-CoA synthetase
MNLAQLADENIKIFGEYDFLTFNEKNYTNVELRRLASRLGYGLRTRGVGPGSKVVVLLPNCPEVIVAFQAALRLGATVIPVLFLLGTPEIKYILEHSEAETIITSSFFADRVTEAADGVATVKRIIFADDAPSSSSGQVHPDTFNALMANQPDELPLYNADAHEVAVMLYTSGTTGRPKGVMLTHLNLYANAKLSAVTAEFSRTDYNAPSEAIALLCLPLAHSYGLTVMNIGFLTGARYVLMTWFDPEGAMQLIQQHKITNFSGVPTMYVYMLNHPKYKEYDLSSVTSWGSGSAPLPVEVQTAFEHHVGQSILEGYGLSEHSPVVSSNRPDRLNKRGSIGQPIFGVEFRVVDDDDQPVPLGEVGELILRGPCVMKGYYKQPDLTARVLRHGWLHTGDMVRVDEDGYLYIVERKDDLIIRGGENIYPREVEEALYKHPSVAETSVVGAPDPELGQVVHAFVVLKSGQNATEAELIAFCQQHIAKFKAPKHITFLGALPKNLIGKTIRKELKQLAAKP